MHKDTSNSDDQCRAKGKKHPSKQQKKQGGGGTKWCSVHMTMSDTDDECQLQKKQANNGNASFAKIFQQHHPTAPGEHGFQGGYSFMAITATQEAKSIGGTQGKRPNTFKKTVRDHEKDLNGPSIATVGLFEQNQEDSAFMAVSAAELDSYEGNTTATTSWRYS